MLSLGGPTFKKKKVLSVICNIIFLKYVCLNFPAFWVIQIGVFPTSTVTYQVTFSCYKKFLTGWLSSEKITHKGNRFPRKDETLVIPLMLSKIHQ